jgi:hypothetical protein
MEVPGWLVRLGSRRCRMASCERPQPLLRARQGAPAGARPVPGPGTSSGAGAHQAVHGTEPIRDAPFGLSWRLCRVSEDACRRAGGPWADHPGFAPASSERPRARPKSLADSPVRASSRSGPASPRASSRRVSARFFVAAVADRRLRGTAFAAPHKTEFALSCFSGL